MRTISHEFARRSDFVTALVEKLSLEIYINGNTVFRTGEKANELFIIYSGEVELLTADLVKFKTVSDCTLGESGFFRREQHICDARATKTTEVSWSESHKYSFHNSTLMIFSQIYVLQFDDFWMTLHDSQMGENFLAYLVENRDKLNKFKEQVEKMKFNGKSSKMAKMMDVQMGSNIAKHVILPDSKFRRAWIGVCLLATTYNLIMIPLRVASFGSREVGVVHSIIDLLFDLFFMVDIRFSLKRFATMRDGFLVTDPNEFEIMYKGE